MNCDVEEQVSTGPVVFVRYEEGLVTADGCYQMAVITSCAGPPPRDA